MLSFLAGFHLQGCALGLESRVVVLPCTEQHLEHK